MGSSSKKPNVSTSWREGRYWDHWMLVHLMTGVVIGLFNASFVHLSPLPLYAWSLVGLTVWEVLEWIKGIRESWENRTIDVLIGMAGVVVVAELAPGQSARLLSVAFYASGALLITMCYFGWRAYRFRTRKA